MMILEDCPYCHRAFAMMEELCLRHPEYKRVEIDVIDEEKEPERIKGYNYWYVPTYFVGGKKLLEGVPTIEAVENVLKAALE